MNNPSFFQIKLTGDRMDAHSEITLRDLFAGMAMQGDWATETMSSTVGAFGMKKAAREYYKMADEMLAAREAK